MAVQTDTNMASASIPWIWSKVLVTKVKADECNGLEEQTKRNTKHQPGVPSPFLSLVSPRQRQGLPGSWC